MKRITILILLAIIGLSANAQYTKLLDFTGTANGANPGGSLISDGTFLYGMTYFGGTDSIGVIFKIKPDGTGYSKLLDFNGTNGQYPSGSLISDGTFLYGMTYFGGTNGQGVLFKIMPDGTGYSKLLDFGGSIGGHPYGSLISDGTFIYGMTSGSGAHNYGTIFKILPDGTGYVDLLDFAGAPDGQYPYGSLISDGTFLYGMTVEGGSDSMGVIFKIKSDGTGYSKLLDFNGTNGAHPEGSLISDGTFLYGMTYYGGTDSIGVIFKIKPDGTGYSELLDFNSTNGGRPWGSLISEGTFLYGMASQGGSSDRGVVFKIKPDGTAYTDMLDFTEDAVHGNNPIGSLFSDGTFLYGMTQFGGTSTNCSSGCGVIFKYGLATGIAENTANKGTETDFSIYPNPVSDIVTLNIDNMNNADLTLNIYNAIGELVKSEMLKHNNQQINIGDLSNGVYMVTIKSKDFTITKILIIQR
jgi:uncharacterized repeat protein (TIGR03803 family)